MEQLAILGTQIGVDSLPIVKGETAVQIAKRAKTQANLGGYDVVFLDTAGRLQNKSNLMEELRKVRRVAGREPGRVSEVLLVIDATTGQNGLSQAREFREATDVTGVVHLPDGKDMVMPGDNTDMRVELIQPIAMEEGLRFAIREGGRTVGAGRVTKILK